MRRGSEQVFRVLKLESLVEKLLQAFLGDRRDELFDAGIDVRRGTGALGGSALPGA